MKWLLPGEKICRAESEMTLGNERTQEKGLAQVCWKIETGLGRDVWRLTVKPVNQPPPTDT